MTELPGGMEISRVLILVVVTQEKYVNIHQAAQLRIKFTLGKLNLIYRKKKGKQSNILSQKSHIDERWRRNEGNQ